ncbi:MAG: DNA alkylation repair protein [Clostridia bacterium]|nr:DNA alkylation repair protein [Clostridia bacterium]
MNVREELFKLGDEKYREFHAKLIPTVDKNLIIGVRIPELRKFARNYFKSGEYEEFLTQLPHKYYEENNLHAFLIEQIKDFEKAIDETEKFLPYIDNWATCDSFSPKIFKKNKEQLLTYIRKWISSDATYTVRYSIGLLMNLFLDEDFESEYNKIVSEVRSDEYYINMMIAWYFATALAKQYNETLPYITEHKFDKWVNNKIIQKAVESYRIEKETKEFLKGFKL